jgi:hypothetical protein
LRKRADQHCAEMAREDAARLAPQEGGATSASTGKQKKEIS